MSSVSLIKEPAFGGLDPGLPRPVAPARETAARILAGSGLTGRLTGLVLEAEPPRHFRLDRDAGPPLFLKLVEPVRHEAAIRAERIAAWLAARGVGVPAPHDGFPRALPDGELLVVISYVDGRRVNPVPVELAALGAAAGTLHRALARHPDRPAWEQATRSRLCHLAEIREDLVAGRFACGPDPVQLHALAADRSLDFELKGAAVTPLHGDLNPGNVLVPADGHPVLLDFEDVFHSVLPPIFELLLLVERFILVRIESDSDALIMGQALLKGYRGIMDETPSCHGRPPHALLRALSLRSLCVLAQGARAGIGIGVAEWRKFFAVCQAAARRADTVDRIFAGQIG